MNPEKDPEKFMQGILDNLKNSCGFELVMTGATLEERAESFFELLVGCRFAIFLED
jgi:hypothetical protein